MLNFELIYILVHIFFLPNFDVVHKFLDLILFLVNDHKFLDIVF